MKPNGPPRGTALGTLAAGSSTASLKQRAYAALKSRIVSGTLAPGTLLSERQLAQSLNMSKTPVHAALERLEGEGLVTVTAQQGIVVRAISPEEIADHFELRVALETFVISRLANQLTAEQSSRLKRNLADHRRAIRQGNIAEHVRIDSEFHLLLSEWYGNKEITRAMSQIRDKLQRVMYHISSRTPARMSEACDEHADIATALLEGNGPKSSELMSTHLRNGVRSIYHRQT